MSGHSKWSSIKHKKAAADARKGKLFSRLNKEIMVAARDGGGDTESNSRLRTAVENAREANMPAENINRAIKKGTGELPGAALEECTYEGYGPGGVAIMIEIVTDNKNRTSAEIKKIFSKNGGSLGAAGCVSWLFHKKGLINVSRDRTDEDTLMEIALEAGADDFRTEEKEFSVVTSPETFRDVRQALAERGIETDFAEVTMLPETTVKVEGKTAEQVFSLVEELEEHQDTQNVFANFDIPERLLEELSA